MADEAAQKPRVKAENNPWYLLATLYGQPTLEDDALRARNRTAWNRYMARALTKEARTALLARKGHPADELTRFSDKELHAIERAFAERHRQAACTGDTAIPNPLASNVIDFSGVDFDHPVFAGGFIFPDLRADFRGATFSKQAVFRGATFSGGPASGARPSDPWSRSLMRK